MRTPFFRLIMCNEPDLVHRLLKGPIRDFPKSERLRLGLRLLLRDSVFITNGALWEHQRRIIDPAFEGGRLREVFPAMWDSGVAAVDRLRPLAAGRIVEIEEHTSHTAMDVIFRTLFHKPGWTERNLGDLLRVLVLYGHFRTEHLMVHHPWGGHLARYCDRALHRKFLSRLRPHHADRIRIGLAGGTGAAGAPRAWPLEVKILCKLDHGLLAFDRGYRHFRLESRTVVPARSSCHGLLLARSIMLLLRGKSTYPGCSDFRSRLSLSLTPRILHIRLIGKLAFSASMKANFTDFPPSRRRPRWVQTINAAPLPP